MEDIKTIRLKDLFFYLFISWRTILASVLIFAFLGWGYTALQPTRMIQQADVESPVKLPDNLLSPLPPYDFTIEEPENPYERYSESEIQLMIQDMILRNYDASLLQCAMSNLEQENLDLKETLEQDPYLQIDPKAKTNKQFRIVFKMDEKIKEDDFSNSFFQQSLISSYLTAIRAPIFAGYIADSSPIPLKSESIPKLIRVSLEKQDTLLVKVTAADEELREALYNNSIDAVQRLYDESNVSFIKHNLEIIEGSDETLEDIGIETEILALQKQINDNEEAVISYKKEVEELFLEKYRSQIKANKEARKRDKQEAIHLLTMELAARQVPDQDIDEITKALELSNWSDIGIKALRSQFQKALEYDVSTQEKFNAPQPGQDLFPAVHEQQRRILARIGSDKQTSPKESKPIPVRKPFRRNTAAGILLGGLVGCLISLMRYWNDLSGYDIQNISAAQNIPYIGKISIQHPRSKKRWGAYLDRLICRVFGMGFRLIEQQNESDYIAQFITQTASRYDEEIKTVLIPINSKDEQIEDVFEHIKKSVASVFPSLEVKSTDVSLCHSGGLQEVNNSDSIVFMRHHSDELDTIVKEVQLAKTMNKPVLGVVEIVSKW